MNPQDDLGSPTKAKQLYICCHIRQVEMIPDAPDPNAQNDDSGGGRAAIEPNSAMTATKRASGLHSPAKRQMSEAMLIKRGLS